MMNPTYQEKKIDGKPLRMWSKISGIPTDIIYRRYFENGWDAKRAIWEPVRNRKERIECFGIVYSSHAECARANGIDPKTYWRRVKRGLTPEEACFKGKMPKKKKQKQKTEVPTDPYVSRLCPHKDCFTCPYYDCIYGE